MHVLFIVDKTPQLPKLLTVLWDTLLDLDDLTASTSSVMSLLSRLLTFDQVRGIVGVLRRRGFFPFFARSGLSCV
jgi:hypothetical protein